MNKNSKLLKSFTAYAKKHPEMRFWQALSNWSGIHYILWSARSPISWQDSPVKFNEVGDTYNWEKKNE